MEKELVFSQSEMLVFMDALGVDHLPGVDNTRLYPRNYSDYKNLVAQGLQGLEQRGITKPTDGKYSLPSHYIEMFRILSAPEVLIISQRHIPHQGKQIFLHYLADGKCVELTFPTETTYRTLVVPTAEALIIRLLEIYPLQSQDTTSGHGFFLKNGFQTLHKLAQNNDIIRISNLLAANQYFPDILKQKIIAALMNLKFSGTLTILKMRGKEAIAAKDYLCLQGEQTAWICEPAEKDPNWIVLQTVQPEVCSKKLSQALGSMLAPS